MEKGVDGKFLKQKKNDYKMAVSMNGQLFDFTTDDIKESLKVFKPEQVHTEAYISITRGIGNFTRKLSMTKAKTIFGDKEQMDLFLTNLLF